MKDISVSGENPSKIVSLLSEIAFQTNLLALSASVQTACAESPRAGLGRTGEEIHSFALRSAQTANDMATLIERSFGKAVCVSNVQDGGNVQSRGSESFLGFGSGIEMSATYDAPSGPGCTATEELAAQARRLYQVLGRARTQAGGLPESPIPPSPEAISTGSRNSEGIAALRAALVSHARPAPPPTAKRPPTQEFFPLDTNESTL